MAHHALPAVYAGLTAQECAFVFSYCQSGNAELAKRTSGYTTTTGGHMILRRPAVAAAVRAEITRLLATEGATIAYSGLARIARDTKAPAAAQVAAQKALLQAAGLLEAPQQGKEVKSINDMSRDELRDYIESKREEVNRFEAELANRAANIGSGSTSQPSDMFD